MLQKLLVTLSAAVKVVAGAWVEDNHFALSIHYRECKEEDVPRIEKILADILAADAPEMTHRHGKKVIEIGPGNQLSVAYILHFSRVEEVVDNSYTLPRTSV